MAKQWGQTKPEPTRQHSPFVRHQHLAQMDLDEPIDRACIEHATASLRSGSLVGYDGWLGGEFPEVLQFTNGVPTPDPKRPFARCHDPLPWPLLHTSFHTGLGLILQHRLCDAVKANRRVNMAMATGYISTAHKGGGAGYYGAWEPDDAGGTGNKETYGHHLNSENYLFHYLETGSQASRDKWNEWVAHASGRDTIRWSRDEHAHLVRCHLAYQWGNGDWWYHRSRALATHLIEKPLSEHNVPLNNPLWPLALVYVLDAPLVEDWLLEAAEWAGTNPSGVSNAAMVLSALAYWLSGEVAYLERHLPALRHYPYTGFHGSNVEEHRQYEWHGVSVVGRRGSQFVELSWPVFKRAMQDAGLTFDGVARMHNSIPMTDKHAILVGDDLRAGWCEAQSYGGDGHASHLHTGDIHIAVPAVSGSYVSSGTYELPGPPVESLYYHTEGRGFLRPGVGSYRVQLEPDKWYDLGNAVGWLRTAGNCTVEAMNEHVSFFDIIDKPTGDGLWQGLTGKIRWQDNTNRRVDARGPTFARWRFTLEKSGTWEPIGEGG